MNLPKLEDAIRIINEAGDAHIDVVRIETKDSVSSVFISSKKARMFVSIEGDGPLWPKTTEDADARFDEFMLAVFVHTRKDIDHAAPAS